MRFGSLSDPPVALLITGARVVDPSSGADAVRDVAVADGVFVEAGSLPEDVRRVDGSGLVAAPAFCDLHAHLREPGGAAESVASGTRAAARGGFTTVCAMPNTDPPLDEPLRVAGLLSRAADVSARIRVIATATRGRTGERLVDFGELAAVGAVGFSDDGAVVASPRVVRSALSHLAPLRLPLVQHAEDPVLAAGAMMRGGATATRLGLGGWPATAESTVVERDIALAEETGARLHLTHLSTAASLAAVRRAKERGLPVTCDVTPHHLALTDTWVAGDRRFAWQQPDIGDFDGSVEALALDPRLAYDGRCRVNPPLTTRDDALALLAGVADSTVDAIATDHAPHPPERKLVEFAAAAPGISGLETALSVGLAAVEAGRLRLVELLAALGPRPAALIGESRSLEMGMPADLVLFDPAARWTVSEESLVSGGKNTPLLGMELPGVVGLTLAGGRITYEAVPPAS